MKNLLLISVSFLLLQSCSFITDTKKPKNVATTPMVVEVPEEKEVKSKEVSSKTKTKSIGEYLYYYVAHSFSQADIEEEAMGDNRDKPGVKTESNGYGHMYTFNGEKSLILSEVVSKMADQLLYNFPKVYQNETIALTSIVDLSDHTVTNWLGQTVSEQFIHELHIRKLRVIDYKFTGNIQITKSGEFAITRDWKKLNQSVDVQRILTGTMSRNEEGVIFNIRIVNANTSIVESTSSAFVPNSMFSGGQYDYQSKKYYMRDSRYRDNKSQVRLVK